MTVGVTASRRRHSDAGFAARTRHRWHRSIHRQPSRREETGLRLAILPTATSFFIANTDFVGQPSIPVALVVLASAQMGVHLVFLLHITTGPDNTNNILALAFGVLIVILLMGGSLWIMANLNHNMMPMDQIMQMQR